MKEKTIGKTIKEARKKKKINQEELAKHLHISRQTLSNWENDKYLPDINLTLDLCKYLGIELEQLFVGNVENLDIQNIITNEKRKTFKKVSIFTLSIVITLSFMLFLLLAVFNSNKMVVYKVSLDTEDFQLNNSLFIDSKVQKYFQFGTLLSNLEENKKVDHYHIKLYYLKENRLILECEYEDNLIIQEDYGYNEYFQNSNFDDIYLDISYYQEKERKLLTYKLNFELLFKSDLLNFKHSPIGNKNQLPRVEEKIISPELLLKAGYKYSEEKEAYEKNEFQYKASINTLMFSKKEEDTTISADYHIDKNWIEVDRFGNKITSNIYYLSEKNYNCTSNTCEHYKKYLELILREYERINGE